MTETLKEALRLIRKYQSDPKEKIGQLFLRVARALEEAERPRRDDLAKMLKAWGLWEELGPDLQSDLLDCIEHTYGFGGPSRWNGLASALQRYADDPMWADHAEVPKILLQKAAMALSRPTQTSEAK